jgi:hypothetical protein
MAKQLRELLQSVQVAEPQEISDLQLFGLCWESRNGLTYTTLDDALAAKTLDITEIPESGSVPALKVVNKAENMVFLMSGEQLIGAKQNRVVNASIMVAGRSEMPIPVSCVQAGRWRYHSPKFFSGGTMSHGHLRKLMSRHALGGYRRAGKPTSEQGEVWSEVARKLEIMGSPSYSAELQQAYADYEYTFSDLLGQLQVPKECCGVAFALAGQIAGADLFDKQTTLVKLWPKLVRAYMLDALEGLHTKAAPVSRETVRQWFQSSAQASVETFKSPGVGDDVRLEGASLVGAALVVDEEPIHVELFHIN